jgi:hypothetical protein
MAALRLYRSDDASAPSLTGEAGSLVAMLSAILVDGYGSQPAAGWTKPFTDTHRAAFRMAAGDGANGHYLYVDDTGTTDARVTGCVSMAGIDARSEAWPAEWQLSGGAFVRKSGTASSVVRPWLCAADDRRLYLFTFSAQTALGGSASTDGHLWFGQLDAVMTGDGYATLLSARAAATTSTSGSLSASPNTLTPLAGHFLPRGWTQLVGPQTALKCHGSPLSMTTLAASTGGPPFPNPVTGSLDLSPIAIYEAGNVNPAPLRGYLPGLYAPLHALPGDHLQTVAGTGALAGKTFLLVNVWNSSTAGRVALQIGGDL